VRFFSHKTSGHTGCQNLMHFWRRGSVFFQPNCAIMHTAGKTAKVPILLNIIENWLHFPSMGKSCWIILNCNVFSATKQLFCRDLKSSRNECIYCV
jgi:hypothetical protein